MVTGISRAALLLALPGLLAACSTVQEPIAPIAQVSAAPAAAPSIAPLQYTSRTLANGLRVYSARDEASPNVAIQVFYEVGGRDDPRARSGFAHLFEHLMFKSTRNMPAEMLDRLTEDVGGENNAFTAPDVTGYHEIVPANHLQRLLWAEAERMNSLVIEPGFFASERDVVKEELRSRVHAAPYGKLFRLYYPAVSYQVHPYARMVAGSLEDLDAATVEDVRAFHATYYRPDNAVLVVAGNFDQAQLDQWVDTYFAPIARPAAEIPRVTAVEPERIEAVTYTVYEPNTPLPATLLSYPMPRASSEDAPVAEVLDAILSTGQSSRLYQSLVYRDQISSQASSWADIKKDGGNLVVYSIAAGGRSPDDNLAALRAQVARFRDEPVTAAELAEAKNELLTSALRERETVDGRAGAIANAVIVSGDAAAADRRLARIASVTPEDIQRVAREWLRDERSAAIQYLPEQMRPNPQAGDTIGLAPTVQTRILTTPEGVRIVDLAPEAERIAPPAPAAPVVATIPAPVTQRLANGLTVISVERRDLPLMTAVLVAGGGSANDPQGRAGLGELTSTLLTQGTATRSATEIAQAVEALGASLESGADWDGSSLSLTVKSDQADRALAIISDVAQNPAFAAEELERQRTIAVDGVTVNMSDPGAVARMVAARALYGSNSYGHPGSGTANSLRAITRDDVASAYAAAWAPANATLILTGDVDPASALALAERHFGTWSRTASAAPRPADAAAPARQDVVVIDMPGAGQAAVAVTRAAIARRDPRYYRALVANAVLGTGYSARLNQEIRIRRGLAYGASSALDARREQGPFIAVTQTKNESAAEVLGLILAEMRRLGAEPIPAAEMGTRQAVLTGSFGRNVETTSGLAGLISTYVQRGVEPEELGRYQRSVLAVTPEQAQGTASELLGPQGVTMVIVGDASKFIDRLRRERSNVTVIPLAELNLDRPELR